MKCLPRPPRHRIWNILGCVGTTLHPDLMSYNQTWSLWGDVFLGLRIQYLFSALQ